ncbi:MAG: hypothetical protein A2V88_01645 [Elusimicrobia bacterium RBG_16_66_12]|nr:MAG: hypothetical protein A2V88_01645 [Elusimicrobia bacterium RBG_16_66_12]
MAESGESFLFYQWMRVRSYRDGDNEVVLIGRDRDSILFPRNEPYQSLQGPADFPAQLTMRLEIIPKTAPGAGASIEDAAKRAQAAWSAAGIRVGRESVSDTWPPGSFILRAAPPASEIVHYTQTKDHWVVWTAVDPNVVGLRAEYDLLRRSLSEFLEEKSREDGLREALPKPRIRKLPKDGYDNYKEFEGQAGLRS